MFSQLAKRSARVLPADLRTDHAHYVKTIDTTVNMYNALVMPYFNYCGAVWGNINKGLADKLQKLQNRAARILTFSNYDVRSSVLLDELG